MSNSTTNAALTLVNGIGNQVVSEDQRDRYTCPECNNEVYVVKGLPFRGACADCLKKKSLPEQVASGVTGVLGGLLG